MSESSTSSNQSSTKATPKTSSSSSVPPAGKTLFQIDHSFIGNHQFEYRSRSDLKNTTSPSDPTANQPAEQFLRTSVYCIRLNRLLKDKAENKAARQTIKQKFKLKRTRDLVHTICALYDNSLPDIGAQSVYDCICSPKSFTICVLKESDNNEKPLDPEEDVASVYGSHDNLKSIEDAHEYPESCFSNMFSDPEESEEDDSEGSNKMDFTYGLKTFVNKCRREDNKEPLLKDLIAVATIQKTSTFQLPGQDEWVVDLELMSVRPKYRKLNIGKYLINLIQNKNYVGNFDAIVTSSDLDAIKFYEKFGFNIDPILNSKYKFIGDIWTNTTKMCYIPPYCQPADKNATKLKEAFSLFAQTPSLKPIESTDQEDTSVVNPSGNAEESFDNMCVTELTNMENDFKRWQKLMFSAYQSQAQIFFKVNYFLAIVFIHWPLTIYR